MSALTGSTRLGLPRAASPLLVSPEDAASQTPDIRPNRFAQVIDGQVALRTQARHAHLSDDSSLSSDGAGLGNGDDTASDSEDSQERMERILNSSDTNSLLDNLNMTVSSPKAPEIAGTLLDLLAEPIINPNLKEEHIIDEFPLFPDRIRQSNIMEEERALSTPEKRGFHELDDSSSDEGSISKRTRSAALQDVDSLSPISKKMQHFQNSKSRIPLPVSQIAVRRSKRLELPEDDKGACSPKRIDVPLKPVLKIKSTVLNYIVDASSGFLHDATKYATEMNSLNGEGVPIPQTANELVTIPINERKAAKNPRSALVRGTSHKVPKASADSKVIGFYSEAQYKKYLAASTLIETVQVTKKEKKLRWAEELEW